MGTDWQKLSHASRTRAIALLVFCVMLSLAVLSACSTQNETGTSSPTAEGAVMKGSIGVSAVEADDHDDGVLGDNVLLPEGIAADEYADYVERLEGVELEKTDLGEAYKQGRLGVWFSKSCGETRAREIVAERHATWLRGFEMHDVSIDVEVELSEEADEMEEIKLFEAYPEVRFATLEVVDDLVFGDGSDKLVAGSLDSPKRDLINASDGQKYHLAAARFYGAWEGATCDQDVVVAIFDTGKPQGKVDDFGSNIDGSGAYDAVNGWIGGAWVVDGDGHGTAVAGIISAEVGNNKGTDGASHGAVILPVKVAQGSGLTSSWDSVIRGLDHLYNLDELPDVVNMSFGKHYGADGITVAAADYARYEVMQEMISDLHDEGVVFVAAAGNMDELNPADIPFYPAYGWLYVPGTEVSMPLARREGDGSFYLDHDSLGNESAIGCAYTTGGAGMSDPATVLYGHSFAAGDLAFTSLHSFEDAAFFAGHDEAYVYLPGRRLEYRVVGAYLFNAFAIEDVDQADAADLADYFAELSELNPSSFVGYKRRGKLDPASDRVLQLSTCTVPADPAHRFVVTCVYEGEEAV